MRVSPLEEVLVSANAGYWGGEPGSADRDVRVVRNGDVQSNGLRWQSLPLRSFRGAQVTKSLLRPNDVLITTSGEPGRVAMISETPSFETCATNFVRVLRFDTRRVHPRYAFHYLSTPAFRASLAPHIRGTTMKNLSTRDAFSAVGIPIPHIEEQRRIAAILDRADTLRASRVMSLELRTELDMVQVIRFIESVEGRTLPLADVVADGTSVTYGIVQAGPEYPGGVPYIRTGDLKDGRIVEEQLRHTDPQLAAKFHRSKVAAGDLVMSIRATVGTVAQVPPTLDGANLTQGTARISPGTRVMPSYLLAFLRSPTAQHWIEGETKGATFREITLQKLRELPVFVPSLTAQQQFVQVLSRSNRVMTHCEAQLAGFNDLFAALQARAFSGRL